MSSTNLYETRHSLQLNNEKIPPIEEYGKRKNDLQRAYVDWLEKEPMSRHLCYADLTFEVPNESVITFVIGPKTMNSLDGYMRLLADYIDNGNTLYSHYIFQQGIPKYEVGVDRYVTPSLESELLEIGTGIKKTEQFFLHDLQQSDSTNNNLLDTGNNSIGFPKLSVAEFGLSGQYEKQGEQYLIDINSKSIEYHWQEWKNINGLRKEEIVSSVNSKLRWLLAAPLGVVFENGSYIPLGSIFLGMDSNCSERHVIDYLRMLVLCISNSSLRFYFQKSRADIANTAAHELSYILSAINSRTPGFIMDYLRKYLELFLIKKIEFSSTIKEIKLLGLLKEFVNESFILFKVAKMANTGDFSYAKGQIEEYKQRLNSSIKFDQKIAEYFVLNDSEEKRKTDNSNSSKDSKIALFQAAFFAGFRNALKHTDEMSKVHFAISIEKDIKSQQMLIQILNSYSYDSFILNRIDVDHAHDLSNTKSFMSIRNLVNLYGGNVNLVSIKRKDKKIQENSLCSETWITQIPVPTNENILFGINK